MRIFSNSEEETIRLGELIGRALRGGEVICLYGPLGAGKTTLVKGIARGMGILEGYQVRSPTFTLVNEYPTQKGPLLHADLYRVGHLDLDEFVGRGVLVIEWADRLEICQCLIKIHMVDEGRVLEFEGCDELVKVLLHDIAG